MKNLEIDKDYLAEHSALVFTCNKKSPKGDGTVHSWNTAPRFFPEDMKAAPIRIKYLMDNAKAVGLDDLAMPDQPKEDKLIEECHEITFEEFEEYYQSNIAQEQGTIWNVEKNYLAIFMTKETHDKIKEKYGRSVSLVYPAADCAVVRFYDKDKEVIGLTHSDANYTATNLIGKMADYMEEHFASDRANIEAYVGAFANEGWEYTGYPNFAATKDENGNIISYNSEWSGFIEKKQGEDDKYLIHYGEKINDQLKRAGIKEENIYFDDKNTLFDKSFFSHVRSVQEGEKEGRNLYGITFDKDNVLDAKEETDAVRIR